LLGSAVSGVGSDILKAVERLCSLDVNRLVAGVDYEIDLQGRSPGYEHDAAPGPLFSNIDERVWQIPTFQLFYPPLHLYHAETGVEWHFTRAEIDAQRAFLHIVCRTPCMRFAQAWLVANKKIRVRNAEEFETMLWEMWFGLYRRDRYRDSSAFEHVFVGEVDNGQVRGMHTFLQLYQEENAGNLDYYGYLLPRPRPNSMTCPSNLNNLLTIRFSWRGVTKAASSVIFGVSPEFELALYTMLFIAGRQENNVRLGQYRVCVKVYQMGNKIAAAYPEALAPTPEEAVDEAVTVVQSAFRRRHEVQDLHRRKRDDADLSKKVERLISIGGQRGKLFGL
jgi:poly(U)-specific endoribonuclease